jgi:hypothetical protein
MRLLGDSQCEREIRQVHGTGMIFAGLLRLRNDCVA